jgi:hypothetical protein
MVRKIWPSAKGVEDLLGEEKDDCSVRALANCTGISYNTAHKILANEGRRDKDSMYMLSFTRLLLKHQFSMKCFGSTNAAKEQMWYWPQANVGPAQTLLNTLDSGKYNKGRYIFHTKGHIFAVVDGRIIDNSPNMADAIVSVIYTYNG